MKTSSRLSLSLFLYLGMLDVNVGFIPNLWQSRETSEIVSTSSCEVRIRRYEARLNIHYFYKIEYEEEPLDLLGLEKTLATSIASALNECDENMEPVYAVELNAPSHVRSELGKRS
jgi:hypothetical protein